MSSSERGHEYFPSHRFPYLKERCPRCEQRKLYAIDNKYRCDGCDYTGDVFQDGDSVD